MLLARPCCRRYREFVETTAKLSEGKTYHTSVTNLGLLGLWPLETPFSETAQHQEGHFSSATTLLLVAFEQITDANALVRRDAYPSVGVARAEGESSVKPESEPEEFGRQNLLVFRKCLRAVSKENGMFEMCHFHAHAQISWQSTSSRMNPLTVLYLWAHFLS